ncbi:MAG TPA: DUF2252 family protein [Daejeonella sp.]
MNVDYDVADEIKKFNETRLPELVQFKYGFMAENLYRFFRGTSHLFHDQIIDHKSIKSPLAWICGDLHLENFGCYRGNNGLVYFDLNDFDEALLGPITWELSRVLTSIIIAFRTLAIGEDKALKMTQLFLNSYSKTLTAGRPGFIERQTAKGIVRLVLRKASHRSQDVILRKNTVLSTKGIKLNTERPKCFKLNKNTRHNVMTFAAEWLKENTDGPYNYTVKDAAFRLAGTGSVGVKRYAILLKSSNSNGEKFVILDMKQAMPSSSQHYFKKLQPKWRDEGERIIAIQNRAQNVTPSLLSTGIFDGIPFIIEEMQPEKDSIDFQLIKNQYRDIYQVIDDMAMITASSHLRSSGRQGSAIADELIGFGEQKDWQGTLIDKAFDYANKIQVCYDRYCQAYTKGYFKK